MLLRCENLTKDYGRFRALDQLNLQVAAGEIFGLLGPNGSGKSTALRLLLGFMKPTAGAAWINRHHCWRDSVKARRFVSYLPGELRLYENMTGWQLLRFLSRLRGGYKEEEARQLAQVFDIDLTRSLAKMSSGMKRKVALLVILTAHVPLLILDEPTNTLDPTMRGHLLDELQRARARGQAVLFSSHVLAEVEQVCDRVGILQRGRLVHVQTVSELKQAKRIRIHFGAGELALPNFPGVQHVQRDGDHVVLYCDNSLEPILHWLAHKPIKELTIESVGLETVYAKYHGT